MNTDFEATARRIEANPLGRLMYGQRELFHSNLIAWFFEALPDVADAVFKPLARPGYCAGRSVVRERSHLDLVLRWTDRAPLVIENKVFSLPEIEQLNGYQRTVAAWEPEPALVLLSISAPDFELKDWTYLNYSDFSQRILEALPINSDYEVETMRRYAALAHDLHLLVSAVDVESDLEQVWLPASLLSAISSSQMRGALLKARAQRVARVINGHVPDLETPVIGGMTRATPLVDGLEHVSTGGIDVHMGWQLQGTQFRRAVDYHNDEVKGRSEACLEKREALSREHPEFFGFPQVLAQAPQGRREFNHFAPSFVYRYVTVPEITVGELKALADEVHREVEGLRLR